MPRLETGGGLDVNLKSFAIVESNAVNTGESKGCVIYLSLMSLLVQISIVTKQL